MGNRRFEMHAYRHIITRMRLGDSDRQIAKARLMGRNKAAELRKTAEEQGWLNPKTHLPDDEKLAKVLSRKQGLPTQSSSVDPFTDEVEGWFRQGVTNVVIHRALQEKHGFAGSYSAVRRFVRNLKKNETPEATVMLDYDPGDIAQVDFGAGSTIIDVMTGEIFKTWFFVMTLAWSRHQYVEIVTDQKVLTWLGCHRRAFEFFGGVPAKVIIDNLKAAITKACWHDPTVQRSFAGIPLPG
jgi:transposase